MKYKASFGNIAKKQNTLLTGLPLFSFEDFFMEIFKPIQGYANYEVSNLGRIKSLARIDNNKHYVKERILIPADTYGYNHVVLYNGKKKNYRVHILVAMVFMGFNPDGTSAGIIVDHKNNIKTDNRLDNLQLITPRKNLSKDKFRGNYTSKYIGVSWRKDSKKWRSRILINGKSKHLGSFKSELKALQAYQKALKTITR